MNKELEALENFVRTSVWNDDEFHEIWDNGNSDLEIVKQALLELKVIKESNPSEALKCLEKNSDLFDEIALENPTTYKDNTVIEAYLFKTNVIEIERALLKAQELEKVLKIIKEKRVNMLALIHSIRFENLEYYNDGCFDWDELTKEEFELISRLVGVKNE